MVVQPAVKLQSGKAMRNHIDYGSPGKHYDEKRYNNGPSSWAALKWARDAKKFLAQNVKSEIRFFIWKVKTLYQPGNLDKVNQEIND